MVSLIYCRRIISSIFSKYLCSVLLTSDNAILLSRTATEGTSEHSFLFSDEYLSSLSIGDRKRAGPNKALALTVRVTTPEFYNRLAYYRSLEEFLHNEILHPGAEENQTILVSFPVDFATILRCATATPNLSQSPGIRPDTSLSVLEQLEWHAVRFLRPSAPVQAGCYPWIGNPHLRSQHPVEPHKVSECPLSQNPAITGARLSFLDVFVQRNENKQERRSYRRAIVWISLTQRLEWGSERILGWCGWVLRLVTGNPEG